MAISFKRLVKRSILGRTMGVTAKFWEKAGDKLNRETDIGKYDIDTALEAIQNTVNNLSKGTNTMSSGAAAEIYKGSEGDIKINKTGQNQYDFYIRGEDGWHRDNNSSFGPVDGSSVNTGNAVNQTSGSWNYSYEGLDRLVLDLDTSITGTTATATPTIKGIGNLKIESTGNTILQSALQMTTVANADSDPDKFLVIDGSNNVKYRTGAQVLSDIGAISATLTTEQVQDIVGAMFTSNTETRISATYEDGDGTIDLVVDDMTADTNTNQLTTFSISDGATSETIAHGNTLTFAAGEGMDVAVSATDTVTYSGEDATVSNKGIASFNTDDFAVSSGAVSAKRKMVFSSDFAGRYSLGTADAYITGYPGYWVKSTNSGIHTGQDTSDVTLGVDYVKYCLMMPEDGTVTGFVCDCEWDNANGEVDVDLWKVDAIADTGSALTSVALDHIARITFTDPSDTTYYKALADNGGLDGTAKVFTAGESLLVTGMSEDSTDGSSVYLRPVVTVVYDS